MTACTLSSVLKHRGGRPGYDPGGGDDGSDSSESEDGSPGYHSDGAIHRKKRKSRSEPSAPRAKEADEIRLSPLPEARLWRTWRLTHFTYIQGASGLTGNEILRYLLVSDMTGSDYPEREFWRIPRLLTTLSPKLAAACRKVMNESLVAE